VAPAQHEPVTSFAIPFQRSPFKDFQGLPIHFARRILIDFGIANPFCKKNPEIQQKNSGFPIRFSA